MKYLAVVYRIWLLMLISSFAYSQNKENQIFDGPVIKISEISTNSTHSDFGPSIVQDSLYFTTFNDKLAEKSDNTLRKKEYYDLYKAVVDKQGDVTGPRIPLSEFLTRYNDGPVSWCSKTGELFVTQNYSDPTTKPKPFEEVIYRLRIIIAKKTNGKWNQVVDFPFNNPGYSVGHPAINETGDTLVFSSDKPGGYGDTDLYYSVRKNGQWETPVNLGPKINTAGKEEFAFITDHNFNGRFLIFASKGRNGGGGFDLYYTRFPSDYSEIIRFEDPINSPADDFAMTIPTDASYGYLTSNRPGTGNDDIYKFNFKRNLKRLRELYVFDNSSKRPISGANVTSCDKQTYVTDGSGKIATIPCIKTDCKVTANSAGYTEKTKVLLACNLNSNETTRDTIWMDLAVNVKIILRNIYYDYDKSDILPESAVELNQLINLLKEKPDMMLEIGSHTDSRGSAPYNEKLSQRRAESAVNYIVSHGISRDRIKAKGYGETELLNKCSDGVKCTPQQHRENRRTEIFIPGFGKSETMQQVKGDYR